MSPLPAPPWDHLPAWQEAPWILRGRVVTAWFEVPWPLLETLLNPALLPERAARKRVRFRFYDLTFEALEPAPGRPLAPPKGPFREASFGVPSRYAGMDGECSALLWTDSPVYLTWAREVFGWPVWMGDIALDGSAWSAPNPQGAEGDARLRDNWGTVTLTDIRIGAPDTATLHPKAPPRGNWFVARRVVMQGEKDMREILLVHPTVRSSGRHYAAQGTLRFAFDAPHPLAGLTEVEAEVALDNDIELLIGNDVEVLQREM